MLNEYRYHSARIHQFFYVLNLSGTDAPSFLQKQSTYNIDKLKAGEFHLVSFLDPQGRISFYCLVLHAGEFFKLLIPAGLKALAQKRLEQFLISEDVSIEDAGESKWTFNVGPFAPDEGWSGNFVEEKAFLIEGSGPSEIPLVSLGDFNQWRLLNGWPDMTGNDFFPEIINNSRLYDLSVSENKGCYPGQETVSKIATRRGAAYAPVLIELTDKTKHGELLAHDRKIGDALDSLEWENHHYLPAKILRDFRIQGSKLSFELNGQLKSGKIIYYPLLPGENSEKAQELFHRASELFGKDQLKEAEEHFRLAIKLDPSYSDAYEALGVMLGRQERFLEAIEIMQLLEKVDPSSVMAHTNMSLYLMRLGRIEEAEDQKSKATVKTFQKFGQEALNQETLAVKAREKEEQLAKSEKMYLEVLEIDPEDTLANFGLGSIEEERRNYSNAIVYLEKVILADPNYSVAYLALGKAFKGIGKKEKARETWRDGIIIAAKKGDLMPANQMQTELDQL